MYNLVKYNILQNNLINQGDNVLIGFSGGPDSVFLFHNLRLLKETLSFNLYASHINHMYRGEDADHDEDFVRALCIQYGVKLFVKRKNATEYANELHVTEEEAGRILRYNFFRDNLKSIGGGKIAVAHNLNDQAETVLQRIIRGTGIDGLGAMSLVKDDIIRPILNVKRSDIEKYLKKK
jgi:tRNA(Ile)-lysidine synthase